MISDERVTALLVETLGAPVELERRTPLGGGDISDAERLDTDRGPFFMKSSGDPAVRFEVEQLTLEALATGATALEVGQVLASRDPTPHERGYLLCAFVERGMRGADFEEALGRGLAELHRSTAERFGFDRDTFCGPTRQRNPWTEDWVSFYREHRLGWQARLLRDAGKLDAAESKIFDRLLGRLDQLLDVSQPPSLIHGDLWSGNVLVGKSGGPVLIDPAVYYAHREAELGMMTLFGGFSDRMYSAYHEAWPLPDGWRQRNPLYQLWHVANHATIFGGSYVDQTISLVRRFA